MIIVASSSLVAEGVRLVDATKLKSDVVAPTTAPVYVAPVQSDTITHSRDSHDPTIAGTWTNTYATTFANTWATTGKPPKDTKCAILVVAGKAFRAIYWTYTHTSAGGGINPLTGLADGGVRRGNLLWTNSSRVPGGAFTNSSGIKVPNDIASKHPDAYIKYFNCSDLGPPSTPAY